MKTIVMIAMLVVATIVNADGETPVMVGGNDGLDACMTLGAVVSKKGAKSEVAIYSKPDQESSIVDKLKSGTRVMFCDSSGDDWVGVVFSGDDAPYCGVTSPIEPRQPYQGECKSGWVERSNTEALAG